MEMQSKVKQYCHPKRMITLLLVVAMMGIIFCFSSQNAVESTEVSNGVGIRVITFVNECFSLGINDDSKILEYAQMIDYPIRKMAHMTEYAILAILLYAHFGCYAMPNKRRLFGAWIVTVLYASTDEFHQTFIPGRDGALRDVIIDSIGAMAGLLFISLIFYLVLKHRKKKDHNETLQDKKNQMLYQDENTCN